MLRAGIAGLGWWGRTIVATLNDSQTMRVVAATDLDPASIRPLPYRAWRSSLISTRY